MDAVESLRVWQRACRLSVKIYQSPKNFQEFAFKEHAGLQVLQV